MGGMMLAGGFATYWHWGFNPIWIPVALFVSAALAASTWTEIRSGKALRPFWERACTGIRWRRRFPDAPKQEIREFLEIFIEAFGFHSRRRCCFSPEDRVMDVYQAIHPPGSGVDCMELESLCSSLRKRYGIDVSASWREDITLGEIYDRTHTVAR